MNGSWEMQIADIPPFFLLVDNLKKYIQPSCKPAHIERVIKPGTRNPEAWKKYRNMDVYESSTYGTHVAGDCWHLSTANL